MKTPEAGQLGRLIDTLAELGRHCGDSVPTRGVAFLYICENEGLSIHELAHVSRLTDVTASRSAHSLAAAPNALVRLQRRDDYGVMLKVSLTPAGARLRDRLDALLSPGDAMLQTGAPGRRRRSSILRVLEAVRAMDPAPTFVRTQTFLMICQQPGIELAVLASRQRTSVASVSRAARAIMGQGAPGVRATTMALATMLIDAKTNRRRHFQPTESGLAFLRSLERHVADFTPLRLASTPQPGSISFVSSPRRARGEDRAI